MAPIDTKQKILASLNAFSGGDLRSNVLRLFESLGYNTERQAEETDGSYESFSDIYLQQVNKFDESRALVKEWEKCFLLFQLSKNELAKQVSLFNTIRVDRTVIESYLFFTVRLVGEQYSRTQLSIITREVNKIFPMPVMILFSYGEKVTFSVINRRLHKRDESHDVLEKVTLIKDINITAPHRAHIEILFDLSIDELQNNHGFKNFVELHNAWQQTLELKELNKRFFKDLSNWYFYSQNYIKFPNEQLIDGNLIPEAQNKQMNLIRLITRLIFVWFLKERKLVNNNIFDLAFIANTVKDFNPRNKKAANYYPAILQNLFFATLNQKMSERGFVEKTAKFNKEDQGVKTLYRYPEKFNIPEKEVISLFRDIPFLNGGLFDCLDRFDEEKLAKGKKNQVFVDGFTRKDEKIPVVPDFLFFGDERIVDLSDYYGIKKDKETFQGIINIFNKYKFTIEENTPIEEEIALDPELLGKVFENLLAYYNPETESTARKQTGSFYTPREIVNYMVDESLIAYLKTQLLNVPETFIEFGRNQTKLFGNEYKGGQLTLLENIAGNRWKNKEEELETALRDLISYNEKPHPFNKSEVQQLIFAIDNCKILDPACGSGAFPMGMLHKLVHILAKLDPEDESGNTFWRTLQKQKAEIAISQALDDKDKKLREIKLHEINETFEKNSSDYGRKLYLIENCIYGVDIQTIAVQISKLRFFISLIVDQKEHSNEDNRGIRPLPNLETKFVAANTLVVLDIQTHNLFSDNNPLNFLQNKLKDVRHKYFEAKSRKEKLQFQGEDKKLRKELSEKIKVLLVQNNKDEINKLHDKLKNEKIKLTQILADKEDVEILEITNLFGQIERTTIDKKQEKVKAQKSLIKLIEESLAEKKDSSYKDTVINMADKIASFDPYDQNISAKWFEPEWMFGLNDGFDIVIGNPPYVRVQNLTYDEIDLYKKIWSTAWKRIDISTLFIELGYKLINKTGILCFISSNQFITTEYGRSMRKFLFNMKALKSIVDFGDLHVFENALTYVSIFSIVKRRVDSVNYIRINELPFVIPKNFEKIDISNFTEEVWSLGNNSHTDIIRKLQSKFERLDKYAKCWAGIISGNDDLLLFDIDEKINFIEKSLLLPVVRAQGCSRYGYAVPNKKIFYPYIEEDGKTKLIDIDILRKKYPKAYSFIIQNKKILASRKDSRKTFGEKSGWYGLIRFGKLSTFKQVKIVSPGEVNRNKFGLDISGSAFSCARVFSITCEDSALDIKYLLSLLNSRLIEYYLHKTASLKQGGYYSYSSTVIDGIPLAFINIDQKPIIKITEKILSLKSNNSNADTRKLEDMLDIMIYRLYDLKYEEALIIDSELKQEDYDNIMLK